MDKYFVDLFTKIGMPGILPSVTAKGVLVILLLVATAGVFFISRFLLLRLIRKVISITRTKWDDFLVERKVFKNLPHLSSAVVIYLSLPLLLKEYPAALDISRRLTLGFMIGIVIYVLDRFLEVVHDIYRTFPIAKMRPIKSYIQLVKIFVYIIGIILIITTILNISPLGILSGIGAMTAVLLLVFKDSILGFISSIQLSSNAMIHIGDWIEMPQYGADGDVVDITLQTVKVQNWDKTITTIPIYALISDSFKNWRGMSESGGRRIKKSINIDMRSIRFLNEEEIGKYKKISYLNEYIVRRKKEVDDWNHEKLIDLSIPVNGRRLTNMGTFRAYVVHYLKNHPQIHKDMTFLVRYLSPTEHGLPLEFYVFSNDQVWANYEGIQADIFDHLLASLSYFDLRIYQSPGGYDLEELKNSLSPVK